MRGPLRILFDHCVPRPLKHFLPEHEIATTYERGWAAYKNGELLDAAQAEFDVFLTTDQNLPYQQNVAVRSIALGVLVADSNRVAAPTPLLPYLTPVLGRIRPGEIVRVELPAALNVAADSTP